MDVVKYIKIFVCLVIVSTFSGCSSNQVIEVASDPTDAKRSAQKIKKGDFDYRKMLQKSGISELIQVERHGVYESAGGSGNIDSVVLRIKFVGVDDATGKQLSGDHQLLNDLFSEFSLFLSRQSGIDSAKIGLIAQIGACQAQVSGGNVHDIKCDKAPVAIRSPGVEAYIHKIQYLTQKLHACSRNRNAACLDSRAVLTQAKLQQFCTEVLAKELLDYDFASTCEVQHRQSGHYFLIRDIKVRSYITNGYWEKFDIQLNYLHGKNKDMEFYGDLKITDGKCLARILLRGKKPGAKSFKDNLVDCDKRSGRSVIETEQDLADLFNRYFAKERKT